MKVELGNKGLQNSWQEPFPEVVKCVHCGERAAPAVCLQEDGKPEGDYICNVEHARLGPLVATGKPPKELWPHDAAAFVVYLCLKCLKPTALFNQA